MKRKTLFHQNVQTFLIIIFILLCLFSLFGKKLVLLRDKNQYGVTELKWILLKQAEKIETISLGDSSGLNSVHPETFKEKGFGEVLNLNTYRLAGPSQMAWMVQYLIKKNKKPKVIVLVNSLPGWSQTLVNKDWALLPIDWVDWFGLNPSPFSFPKLYPMKIIKGFLTRLFPPYSINPFDYYFERHHYQKKVKIDSAGFQANYWDAKTSSGPFVSVVDEKLNSKKDGCQDGLGVSRLSVETLETIGNSLEGTETKVVIASPPLAIKSFEDSCTRKVLYENYVVFNDLQEKFKNVHLVRNVMVFPNEYLPDTIHISYNGAVEYSKWLANELRETLR